MQDFYFPSGVRSNKGGVTNTAKLADKCLKNTTSLPN